MGAKKRGKNIIRQWKKNWIHREVSNVGNNKWCFFIYIQNSDCHCVLSLKGSFSDLFIFPSLFFFRVLRAIVEDVIRISVIVSAVICVMFGLSQRNSVLRKDWTVYTYALYRPKLFSSSCWYTSDNCRICMEEGWQTSALYFCIYFKQRMLVLLAVY